MKKKLKPKMRYLMLVVTALAPLIFAPQICEAGKQKQARAHARRCHRALQSVLPNPIHRFWLRSLPPRGWANKPWGHREFIRVMTFNTYNLFSHIGRPDSVQDSVVRGETGERSVGYEKTLQKAEAILDVMPDIVKLQELEGGSAAQTNLDRFTKEFLNELYVGFISPKTNDPYGLQQGFLVKKELLKDYHFRVVSHADRKLQFPGDPVASQRVHVFTRDAALLLITKKGDQHPFTAFFNVHLRSKRPYLTEKEKRSSHSREELIERGKRRSMQIAKDEIQEIVKIIKDFRFKFPETPFILSGDFNRDVKTAKELRPFEEELELTESLIATGRKLSLRARTTAAYYNPNGPVEFYQGDGNYLSPHFEGHVLGSWVYLFRDKNGEGIQMPGTYAEREENLAGDHFPVVVDVSVEAWP